MVVQEGRKVAQWNGRALYGTLQYYKVLLGSRCECAHGTDWSLEPSERQLFGD